jgi:hypothetical protein
LGLILRVRVSIFLRKLLQLLSNKLEASRIDEQVSLIQIVKHMFLRKKKKARKGDVMNTILIGSLSQRTTVYSATG